jgi:hypothetical protein
MTDPAFGDIIETKQALSQEQQDVRRYGNSPISLSGVPTLYHAGDVVHLPYETTETSTIEAVGLAWAAYASGITPAES